jgi:hypothetical protein
MGKNPCSGTLAGGHVVTQGSGVLSICPIVR